MKKQFRRMQGEICNPVRSGNLTFSLIRIEQEILLILGVLYKKHLTGIK